MPPHLVSMRHKELRIALVCYGGVSLAVYMHGVTKEIWHLARASRAHRHGGGSSRGVEKVYRDLFERLERDHALTLRVLPDIVSGASAGGINAIFLAQALHSGQSLDPLTELWLSAADVDSLTDPDARPLWRFGKIWFQPAIEWALNRRGGGIDQSVAPETRSEVRRKVSNFARGRWFEPPFSGVILSRLLLRALDLMAETEGEAPLLPPGHPLDLFVTATDFRGYRSVLRLNSPAMVEESEHRVPIAFAARTPEIANRSLDDPLSLVFAARATASFPGAFPPATMQEIDGLAKESGRRWEGRDAFVARILSHQSAQGRLEALELIDGAVLNNKPFEGAIAAIHSRPAQREVDRRVIYIDPHPSRSLIGGQAATERSGFFTTIFGALSTIPREQPIRDNLEGLEAQSRDALRLQRLLASLSPQVDAAVESLFGHTLFLDYPSPRRLRAWRRKAQEAAANQSGLAFEAYSQAKMSGVVTQLAKLLLDDAPQASRAEHYAIEDTLRAELARRGLDRLEAPGGRLKPDAITFFRAHDIAFRIRRLRLLIRRLSSEWGQEADFLQADIDRARNGVFRILSLYFDRERLATLGGEVAAAGQIVRADPGAVLDLLARTRLLPETDDQAEAKLSTLLSEMPPALRRKMLLTYLGFPFYDVATLTISDNESLTEYDPVKVDRISPEDATSIRTGGTAATLRGTEFYNFGAFFSRAYRENDYLWGRLHGAERMVDLVLSTLETPVEDSEARSVKRALFLAVIEEERVAGRCASGLLDRLRGEIEARLG